MLCWVPDNDLAVEHLHQDARIGAAFGHHVHRHLGVGEDGVVVELGVVAPNAGGKVPGELEVDHAVLKLGEDSLLARRVLHLEELNLNVIIIIIIIISSNCNITIFTIINISSSSSSSSIIIR